MSYHHQLQHRSCNHIYRSPSMNIINSNDHIRDLGITMSGDCSFNEHINMRTKQCRQLTGWSIENIQRKFTKHITGMHSLSYENRLKCLNLY